MRKLCNEGKYQYICNIIKSSIDNDDIPVDIECVLRKKFDTFNKLAWEDKKIILQKIYDEFSNQGEDSNTLSIFENSFDEFYAPFNVSESKDIRYKNITKIVDNAINTLGKFGASPDILIAARKKFSQYCMADKIRLLEKVSICIDSIFVEDGDRNINIALSFLNVMEIFKPKSSIHNSVINTIEQIIGDLKNNTLDRMFKLAYQNFNKLNLEDQEKIALKVYKNKNSPMPIDDYIEAFIKYTNEFLANYYIEMH